MSQSYLQEAEQTLEGWYALDASAPTRVLGVLGFVSDVVLVEAQAENRFQYIVVVGLVSYILKDRL